MSSNEGLQLSKEISTIFNSKVTDIITTIANTAMEVKINEAQAGEELDVAAIADKIKIEITLSNFFEGKFYYILEKKAVSRLADLMMMGDGSAEYEEDHNEAIAELFNQILGAFITDASAQYGSEITNAGITASATKFEDGNYELANISFFTGTIIMDGFDDLEYYIIYTNDLINSTLEKISSQIGEPEDLIDEIPADSSGSFDDILGQFDFDDTSSSDGADFSSFDSTEEVSQATKDLENIYDISLDVSIELGRTRMSIRKILALTTGSIIELNKLAGEPVDILVNQKLMAKGEVVVIDESFGIRLTNLISPEERIKGLR